MNRLALLMFALVLVIAGGWANEPAGSTIVVPTGYTEQEAALERTWAGFSASERDGASASLQTRYDAVMPKLPADQYSGEEGTYVGYQKNVNTARDAFLSEANSRTYGVYAYELLKAETFAAYVERQATLPRNPPDVARQGNVWGVERGREEQVRQGVGWLYCQPDGSTIDHSNPAIATFRDTMFVSCMDTGDTLRVWRSVDHGLTWTEWHKRIDGSGRNVFDAAIEPDSHWLYLPYLYNDADIWVQRMTDFNNGSLYGIGQVEGTADVCGQPHVSVEYIYSAHRVCCCYYNSTTDQVVIAQSTDFGATWATVYTSAWTNAAYPRIKSCQGAQTTTTDQYYFVVLTGANSLMVLESTSGMSGSFVETQYTHSYPLDGIDISASHNGSHPTTVVTFGYAWTATDYNVRTLFRNRLAGSFVSALVDGDGAMCKTPVVSVDYEWESNTAATDYYHLAYYKDQDGDTLYYPMALRCLNDSAQAAAWTKTNALYHETNGPYPIDTLASPIEAGDPQIYYQIDMTTDYDSQNGLFVPAIAWMRRWTGADRDPRVAMPDPDYVGVEEGGGVAIAPLRFSLTPNPTAGRAELSCAVSQAGVIKVSVFDKTGRLVAKVADRNVAAGSYTFRIDASALPAGVYFVKITAPEANGTSPLVVVR